MSRAAKHHTRPTLQDVADSAGVSLKTASRVLNSEPNVTVKTQTAVNEAMKRLGYHPNELARSLKVRRSGVIGVVVPFLSLLRCRVRASDPRGGGSQGYGGGAGALSR